jgi:hypothetical protein
MSDFFGIKNQIFVIFVRILFVKLNFAQLGKGQFHLCFQSFQIALVA